MRRLLSKRCFMRIQSSASLWNPPIPSHMQRWCVTHVIRAALPKLGTRLGFVFPPAAKELPNRVICAACMCEADWIKLELTITSALLWNSIVALFYSSVFLQLYIYISILYYFNLRCFSFSFSSSFFFFFSNSYCRLFQRLLQRLKVLRATSYS